MNLIYQFFGASLIYLTKIDAATITLHKEAKLEGAHFTATRLQCEKTSWIEPDEAEAYDRPSERPIPVPNLFEEQGNEKYTHISLSFKFPDTNLGHFCERMIGYLRQACKKDVNVINAVVFMQKYFTEEAYVKCLIRTLTFAFIDDMWTSSFQTLGEVEQLIYMILEEDIFNLYDPFMRTGINIAYADGKYHGQATDKYSL